MTTEAPLEEAKDIESAATELKASLDEHKLHITAIHGAIDASIGAASASADKALAAARKVVADTGKSSKTNAARLAVARRHLDDAMGMAERRTGLGEVGNPTDEWKECRQTIARFDQILVDLRKTGFTLLGAVVSAAALLQAKNLLQTNDKPGATPTEGTVAPAVAKLDTTILYAKLSAFLVIALLIVALFLVDRIHAVWHGAAIKRAESLERMLHFRLTQGISARSPTGAATLVAVVLYFILYTLCAVTFWLAFGLNDNPLEWNPYRGFVLGVWLGGVVIATIAQLRYLR